VQVATHESFPAQFFGSIPMKTAEHNLEDVWEGPFKECAQRFNKPPCCQNIEVIYQWQCVAYLRQAPGEEC